MPETEKITINMNVVELGQIDVLVEEGFYQNRTDFIRAAIRALLSQHQRAVEQITTRKAFVLGVLLYDSRDLGRAVENGEMIDVKVIGLLKLADDVTADLALAALRRVMVRGSFDAPADVRAALAEAGRIV